MPSPARRFEKSPSLDSLVERVDAQRPGEITGDTIPTGFGSLDKLLGGGLRRRDLILLGGDIGSGKSALALGIALRVAQQSVGVAYLSGEMNEERLMERALAIEGRVAVDELRAAKLTDQTRAGVGAAAVRLRGLPLSLLPLAGEDFETAFDRLTRETIRRVVTPRWKRHLERLVDAVIDAGSCGIVPTTVVDLTGEAPRVTRYGKGAAAPFEALAQGA